MLLVKALSLEMAKIMADASEEAAKARDLKVVIAVMDNHGNLKYYRRMDGNNFVSVRMAQSYMKVLADQYKGALYAITSGICYGLIGYFGTTIMNFGLSISNMLFWRFLISSLIVLIILLPNFKLLFHSPRDSLKALIAGFLFYSASAMFYFISSKYIGTGLAMVMFFLYPAIVALYNFFVYKTKITKAYYLAFFMMLLGMTMLVDMSDAKFNLIGVGAGTLASVGYALYVIFSKGNRTPPMISTLMVSIGCALAFLVWAVFDSSLYMPTVVNEWFFIGALASICTALPILLLLRGLQYISAEQAAMLSVLEPILVVIIGISVLGERVNMLQALGIVIILTGAAITIFSSSAK